MGHFNSHARVGRDLKSSSFTPAQFNFNSHARVGRDAYYTAMLTNRGISTHTPAWGVTGTGLTVNVGTGHFNSHARVGRDAARSMT